MHSNVSSFVQTSRFQCAIDNSGLQKPVKHIVIRLLVHNFRFSFVVGVLHFITLQEIHFISRVFANDSVDRHLTRRVRWEGKEHLLVQIQVKHWLYVICTTIPFAVRTNAFERNNH